MKEKDNAAMLKTISGFFSRKEVVAGSKKTINDKKIGMEILVIAFLLPIIGLVLNPHDVFLLQSDFTWLVIPPLLMSLRYGLAYGLASFTVLSLLLIAGWGVGISGVNSFPMQAMGGVLVVTVLAGEGIDQWRMAYRRSQVREEELERRVDEFNTAYNVLRSSHAQMESRQSSSAPSLQEQLHALQQELEQRKNEKEQLSIQALAGSVLDTFASFEWLEIAGLYTLDTQGRLISKPLATYGKMLDLTPHDALIKSVLESGKLSGIQEGFSSQQTHLLAAVPLMDSEGKIHALLAIQEMEFKAFNDKNLHVLDAMAGHIANVLKQYQVGGFVADATKLQRATHTIRVNLQVPASPQAKFYANFLARQEDPITTLLSKTLDNQAQLVSLQMPMGHNEKGQLYIKYVQERFEERFGYDFKQAGIQLSTAIKSVSNSEKQAQAVA